MPEKFELQSEADELEESVIDMSNAELVGEVGKAIMVDLNQLFRDGYNLSVATEDLPMVFPYAGGPFFVEAIIDGRKVPIIGVSSEEHLADPGLLAEELAHFYRSKLKPEEKKEKLTDEFFGAIGVKMFRKFMKKMPLSEWLPVDGYGHKLKSQKEALAELKSLRGNIKSLENELRLQEDGNVRERLNEQLENKKTRREIIITHHRGYKYATRIDLDRITNWEKLFSLPDAEVRKRFFTSEPDYSGL